MVSARAYIHVFHIDIPWGKTLSLVSKSRLSVKVKCQGNSFKKKMAIAGAFMFHKHILYLVCFSLQNMYKELEKDIDGFTIPKHGYLQGWAKQGYFPKPLSLTSNIFML